MLELKVKSSEKKPYSRSLTYVANGILLSTSLIMAPYAHYSVQ